jgi:hypothetical protein
MELSLTSTRSIDGYAAAEPMFADSPLEQSGFEL